MTTMKFARWIGYLYLLVGVMGFIPALVTPPAEERPGLTVQTGYGYLLGLFAVNVLHNIVHLAVGIWGIVSSRSAMDAVRFARGLAVFYGILTIMGLIPGLNTTLGLIPIFGHDVWLHALTTAVAAYFGYYWTEPAIEVERPGRRRAA
jgi:hypothetical protein